MIIGIPKETKDQEARVGMTPKYVKKLVDQGHSVIIQKGLANLAGIPDEEYIAAGASVVETMDNVYEEAQMIVKFKDYMVGEYDVPIREDHIIWCFFHLGENEPDHIITKKMIDSKATGLAYEMLQNPDGTRPVMVPMSEIAGKLTTIIAANLCLLPNGGAGVCPAAITGSKRPKYVIIGGGHAGYGAAKIAEAFDADVTVFEAFQNRRLYLRDNLPKSEILTYDVDLINEMALDCDVLINAIYPYPGMPVPVVPRATVKKMKKGAVIMDLAGTNIIETMHYTTISEPTYIEEGVVHYGVDNMPSMVCKTSMEAYMQITYPFIEAIANKGLKKACEESKVLSKAMNFYAGQVVNKDVGITHDVPWVDFDPALIKE